MENSDNSKTQAPCFSFFPADWLNDIKLQSCSLEAQGLLINLMCLMHQSEKYGYLLINGHNPSSKEVSHLLRLHHKTYQVRLKEIFLYGVLCEDENKVIYSKRMVKDEYIRNVRRQSGKLGGSPLLKQEVKQISKQKPTPSISSSSSVSSSVKAMVPDNKKLLVLEKMKQTISNFADPRYQKNIQFFVEANYNTKNADAIIYCLDQLLKSKEPIKYPKSYLEKILAKENGNFNERESVQEHIKHKKDIPTAGISQLGEVLATLRGG